MKQVEFFKCKGTFVAIPVMGGWILTFEHHPLETARGSNRVFSELSTVSKVCAENGVNSFTVEVSL